MPNGIHRPGYRRPLSTSAVAYLLSLSNVTGKPQRRSRRTPGEIRIADCLERCGLIEIKGDALSLTVLGLFVRGTVLTGQKL